MKVLMFGWEFPPHISGGLGTASYGLTKGLSKLENVEILFVVPKLYGDEDASIAYMIGAGDVYVKQKRYTYTEFWSESETEIRKVNFGEGYKVADQPEILKEISFIEVKSLLRPYLTDDEFDKFLDKKIIEGSNVKISADGKFYYEEEGVLKEINGTVVENVEDMEEDGKFIFSGKYGSNLMQEVFNYARVAAIIARENEFDIIHAHDWLTYAAGIAAKQVSGKPLVIHVHATEFDRGGEHQINDQVYGLEITGMNQSDKIITVSNLTRNIVINRYGQHPDKVITVYNAVEPQEAENHHFQKKVNEKVVTFLGRITLQKGPAYFVRAAKKVLEKADNVRFVMAGSGDMFHQMIRYTAELGIADRFHFTDFLVGEDVTHMFAISDVYVMPSMSEPFGISPLEAMRSNVPTIISKQSGVAEVLKNAIKVDYWDDDAIADAIYGLITYGGLAEYLKRTSKPEVENLKWENAAKRVKSVYESVLNKK